MKENGLQLGLNPLHDYMRWFSFHGICDLFSAQVPDMMHTLYKGLVIKNISATATLIFHFNGESMSSLSVFDQRLIESYYQQSVNPFSKKSKFRQGKLLPLCTLMFCYDHLHSTCNNTGLSCYFPKLSNLVNSDMKNGGLEAQRAPDLLFWIVFAIGTENAVLPNRRISKLYEGKQYTFNPTEVLLASLVANLELLWYSRCGEMTGYEIAVHFQRICNVADACYTKLRTMLSVFTGRKSTDLSVKRHLWKHAPWFFLQHGSPKTNDCDLAEHDHIKDKKMYNQTSKRYNTNLTELVNLVTSTLMYPYVP